MELPPDAPKFKLAAVSVPRNGREARERARDRVRVRQSAMPGYRCSDPIGLPFLSLQRAREFRSICRNDRLVSHSMAIRREQC